MQTVSVTLTDAELILIIDGLGIILHDHARDQPSRNCHVIISILDKLHTARHTPPKEPAT